MNSPSSGLDPRDVDAGRAQLLRAMFGNLSHFGGSDPVGDAKTPARIRTPRSGSAPAQEFPPGTLLLGKYVVDRTLGRGGMGVVLAVRHRELDELFAIKLLLPSVRDNAAILERFIREARTAARLTSNHIARVHDVGQLGDGTPYLLMEYLDGQDLQQYLAVSGQLALGEAVDLILQACDGLSEAHALGLVHRDIKPANMFVTRRHTGETLLKLLDFGITKQLDAEDITAPGMLIGTPRYMTPEQLQGTTRVDASADIWALGVILYEMTTGQAPFTGSTLGSLAAAVVSSQPVRPSQLRPDLPRHVDRVVMRCLEKRPQRRYASIAELVGELQALGEVRHEQTASTYLLDSLSTEEASYPPTVASLDAELLEHPDGIVDPRSPFYVARPEFEQPSRAEITRPGALLRIKGPRQMGKTTLMVQLLEHAELLGARIVRVDLQLADARILADLDELLWWLCSVVRRRLKLGKAQQRWDDVFGPKDNCLSTFEDDFLPAAPRPLVLALSSIDRLFDWPQVAEEFLSFMRALHEMGKSQAEWAAFRLVLEYSTEMYLPMDINHSPLNVGFAVALTEWNAEIIENLALRHGLSWTKAEVSALMALIGGHPYLVRVALYRVARGMALADLLANASTDAGVFAAHLKHHLSRLQQQPALANAAAQVLASLTPVRLSPELAFKLVSLGLARQHGDDVEPGCDLYRRYFEARLPLEGHDGDP